MITATLVRCRKSLKQMKLYLLLLSVAIALCVRTDAADDHLNDALSPLLTPSQDSIPYPEKEGVWFPNSYGGVTGLVLDLRQVGTDKMLSVRFRTDNELRPWLGKNYKMHSDKTTNDKERGRSERTVVLVDNESLRAFGRKQIICYKIHTSEDRFDNEKVKLASESTTYTFTISEISDDLEVLYLIPFEKSFPNAEFPKLTMPPKGKTSVGTAQ